MADAPLRHPALPVLAERGGTQLRTPGATVLVDTREQKALDFSRFEGWFAGVEKKALQLGERKDLADLVHSLTTERSVFVNRILMPKIDTTFPIEPHPNLF